MIQCRSRFCKAKKIRIFALPHHHQDRKANSRVKTIAMSSTYGAVPTGEAGASAGFTKKKQCNDIFFALLFFGHLVALAFSFARLGELPPIPNQETLSMGKDRGVWKYVGSATAVSLVLSSFALIFMTYFADELIQIFLVASLAMTTAAFGYGIYAWNTWIMIVGAFVWVCSLVFTYFVWNRAEVRYLSRA